MKKIFLLTCFLLSINNAYSACVLSITPLNFGYINPRDTATSSGSINISCTPMVNVRYTLRIGGSGGGPYGGGRAMFNSSDSSSYIVYNIYSDINRTVILGDGGNGSKALVAAMPTRSPYSIPYYGMTIPGSDKPSPGNYGDTLTVTFTY